MTPAQQAVKDAEARRYEAMKVLQEAQRVFQNTLHDVSTAYAALRNEERKK